ncbi:MAG: ATP-binding protein, partial [Elusimicrobiota bacterium]
LSFADILSEARKYGLNLILSQQYIEQLESKIKTSIFGNVGTIISFRLGAEDAKVLAREFNPYFEETDLTNLSNYHIYLKLLIDGTASKAFSAVTLPSPKSRFSHRNEIIKTSRAKYGRPREEVEREIIFRSNLKASKQIQQRNLFS